MTFHRPLAALVLAVGILLVQSGCLPMAPPPLISPVNTTAAAASPAGSTVISQRIGAEITTDAAFYQTQIGRSFGDRFAAEASFGFGDGLYDPKQRREPEPDAFPQSGEQVLGVMEWLAAGRGGGSVELPGPFLLSGGLGYGQGDKGLEYATVDATFALAGNLTQHLWGSYTVGLGYTHLFDPGGRVHISPMHESYYEAYERRSTLYFLTGAGAGFWMGEHVGLSGEINVGVPTTTDGEGGWFLMAASAGLHIRI
jgi:hypothetical protein